MTVTPLSLSLISEARRLAGTSGRSFISVLAEECGLSELVFPAALAATARKRLVGMAELRLMQPVFDIMSLAEGMARNCHLFRDEVASS